MTALDFHASLLTKIYATLTADATLKTLMGGTVRLYPVIALPDATFPYLVQRLDMSPFADYSPQMACSYYLDIWSTSPTVSEALNIRTRLTALLDGLASSTDEITEFWMWAQTEGFIADSSQIWHYAMQFNLKWTKDAQIGALLKR